MALKQEWDEIGEVAAPDAEAVAALGFGPGRFDLLRFEPVDELADAVGDLFGGRDLVEIKVMERVVLAVLSLVNSPTERNIAVSLTVPIAFLIGGGGCPTLIGFFGDVSSFGLGIALVGGLVLTGAIFPGYVKLRDRTRE